MIQRRLLTATKVARAVKNRSWFSIPSSSRQFCFFFFAATVFRLAPWAAKEQHNLYKIFLWAHATTAAPARTWEWFRSLGKQEKSLTERLNTHFEVLTNDAASWWEEDEWVLSYHRPFQSLTESSQHFNGTQIHGYAM